MEDSIRAVATSPSGELLAVGRGTQVRVEDAETGELRFSLDRPVGPGERQRHIESLAWLPDGWHLAAQWRGVDEIGVWSVASGAHRQVIADLTTIPRVAELIDRGDYVGPTTAPMLDGQWAPTGELMGTCAMPGGREYSGVWQVDPAIGLATLIDS